MRLDASGTGAEMRPSIGMLQGLHQVAFHVESRTDVDQLSMRLLAIGAEVLAPPAE